jgi:hypothetical protein
VPKHREGHAPLVSVHSGAVHGGAHLPPEPWRTRVRWIVAVLVVLLAAVLVTVLLVVLAAMRSDETGTDRSSDLSPTPLEPQSTVDRQALPQCRAAWHAVQDVLDAAEPSMRQWEVHIAAMNKLVAGEITLAQASAFWEETRVGAQQRYDAFAASDRREDTGPCPVPDGSDPAAATLRACARAVSAAEDTRRAARTTLSRWNRHITDMDRLRAGLLSPSIAQQMWLSTWRQGAAELRVYHQRERASTDLRCTA